MLLDLFSPNFSSTASVVTSPPSSPPATSLFSNCEARKDITFQHFKDEIGWKRVSAFFQALGQRPIFANVAHNRGFLHRLDIPSSGLILAATTFEVGERGSNQLAYQDVCGSIS